MGTRILTYDHACEECKNGKHDHMNASEEKKQALVRHEYLDAIDCKNPVGEGQCICPLWQQHVSRFPTEIIEPVFLPRMRVVGELNHGVDDIGLVN